MNPLIQLAVAPVLICLCYIYFRDKYEKEPYRLLITGVLYGALMTFPIVKCENLLALYTPTGGVVAEALFSAFVVAAFVEESFKFVILYFLVYRNKNFNERFDGIVYAVFISLGFAGYENIMYVLHPELGGLATAVSRAFVSVPAHGFFGVTMGYYFSLGKFLPESRSNDLLKAFVYPFLLHGFYDFFLLAQLKFMLVFFVVLFIIMWVSGFRKMQIHLEHSPFRKIKY